MTTINLQTMRYINLLDRLSRVKTSRCFVYNNVIMFAVPKSLVSQAIGNNACNVREMQDQLGKKIRIIEEAQNISDADKFLKSIVAPVGFKSAVVENGIVTINAGSQSKAALIGRNKRRLDELKQIAIDHLGVQDLKIV